MRSVVLAAAIGLWAASANAHLAIFTKGMWCQNGTDGNNLNSDDPVTPLYELEQDQWWFHAVNGCNNRPPADGDILSLPAGSSVTVEIAANQGYTSLSFGGQFASDWPDGQTYPDNVPTCITTPNMHTQNQSMAAGTALAIAYVSDIADVTPENLVVFSVAYNTPWKRMTTYDIPADMPACPEGGCICGWGWIPNACGQANIYHEAIRCTVTGATSTTPVGTPQPPVWCEDDPSACVTGPKQMLYWHQASGNNIEVTGTDLAGELKSPAYNAKCGFADGAQNDIFTGSGTVSPPPSSSAASQSSSSATTSSTADSNESSSSSDSSSSSATSAASSDSSATSAASSDSGSSSDGSSPTSDAAPTPTPNSNSDLSNSDSSDSGSNSDAPDSFPSSIPSSLTSSSTISAESLVAVTAAASSTTTTSTSTTTDTAASSSSPTRNCKPRKRSEPVAERRAVDHRAVSAHRRKAHQRLGFD
ncbi:hypothetical protein BDP27DRAFT_1372961 [Rhodocollybia butyracea]|uniref:Uncharacterized protein n=1 Tax=Rhodocollybia butyracea TaxID=206335 RepID=A0A9P5TXJ7_9AGAR|nr:hypothetical protein BDP27DRAFT_1372961 [Rhodocollybia butyracea]